MRRARVLLLSLLVVLAVVLAACSPGPNSGSLKVTVGGLPGGVLGSVLVTGPGGFSLPVHTTTTLTLSPGTYSVTAGAVSSANAVVATVYDGSVSASSVAVTTHNTSSATVAYAVRPGSGHLWLGLYGGTLETEAYPASALTASGSPSPDATVAGGNDQGETVAFDGSGNMWVGDAAGYLYRYNTADLTGSATATPAVTIDATAYSGIGGIAFDASGNLWAATSYSKVVMYSPAQLSAGGTVTPQVVLSATSATPASLQHPLGIAFDAQGDLWVANTGSNTVVEFTPTQLSATGSPAPAVTLSSAAISTPFGVAFDASGNLWVGNDSGTVLRFDASQLATGSPTPAATLAVGSNPDGVTFDASGALWVGDYNGGSGATLLRFTNPGALTGTVAPTPDATLSSVGATDFPEVAFDPPPANSPIQTP